jgi:hypothetical protein
MTVVECVKDTGTKRRANTSTGGGQVRWYYHFLSS